MINGDRELAQRVQERLGKRHPVFAVATVKSGEISVAGVGAELTADFEIGSISKGVTGLLYADALAREQIASATTLGDLLPLGQAPAAALTLAAVSTHHSGLPRLAPTGSLLRKTIALWRHGANPYGETLAELLTCLDRVQPGKPRFRYSNLGYELLGHALARAARTSYPDLLRQRITEPLGLHHFYLPETPYQIRSGAVPGRSKSGRPREPWTGEAVGPAGGIRASIQDMATLTAALLDGSAPGIAALDPVTDLAGPRVRIGAAWLTQLHQGREITWHNGGTGGFRTWLGLDRAASTGAVLLSATTAPVDRPGFSLLAKLST
ncbi:MULTISPECIES: serine hydrolase domain-containing protein [unclassified Crossiella]|uniref:serine hydrolase domain-containing protein n=1 Tax=unclassified Crossiella TaxID=2620835 RepID=UPI001FFF1594|nr:MULTISPECIES: serine hydrolase domain-containing protein [unclassified Crossiella]MCK2241726.1 beta-lactamase family protein [Crossiella sp. S99.2]MCK2255402.1 beta-lactamase family protein [Crossiella sp. S99.1]